MSNNNRYEFLMVLRQVPNDEANKNTIERLTADFTSDGATVEQVQNMDRRDFTYEAGDLSGGQYVNFIIATTPDKIDVLRAKFKLDKVIYRLNVQKLKAKTVASEA